MDVLEYTKFRYFSIPELQKSVFPKGSSVTNINYESLVKLDYARKILGEPIYLNCSFRSKDWDISHGRNGLSSHCKGRAFDIRCTDKSYRFRLIYALASAGFVRIGVYPTFVHCDDDVEKTCPIMWLTESQL